MTTQTQSAGPIGADRDDSALPGAFSACRLSTAHLAIAVLVVLCAAGSVSLWPAVRAGGHPLEVDRPANCVVWAALAYLIITALAELRTSWRLDHGRRSTAGLRLLAHLLVLVAATVAIGRGFHSLALLAGLYVILPALVTVSFLTLIVGLVERRTLRHAAEDERLPARPTISSGSLLWLIVQWIAALVFVGMLFYLEEQPTPHDQPAGTVESSR